MCLLAGVLSVSSAMASTDWEEIRGDERLEIKAASYRLYDKGTNTSYTVSVFDLCRAGAVVRRVRPIEICTRKVVDYTRSGYPFPTVCKQKAVITPEAPIRGVERVCVKTGYRQNNAGYRVPVCLQSERRLAEIPMTHKIRITEYLPTRTYYAREAGSSWTELFEIPRCR